MSTLPNDVWHRILEIGTKTGRLDHKDLCSLAMTSKDFDELSGDTTLWATLLHRDFSSYSMFCGYRFFYGEVPAPSKSVYREKFEKKRRWIFSEDLFGINPRVLWPLTAYINPQEPLRYSIFTPEHILHREDILPTRHERASYQRNHSRRYRNEGPIAEVNIEEDIRQASTNRAKTLYYVGKAYKSRNKGPRPKTNPNSKSYISPHKPPRRAMPRKN